MKSASEAAANGDNVTSHLMPLLSCLLTVIACALKPSTKIRFSYLKCLADIKIKISRSFHTSADNRYIQKQLLLQTIVTGDSEDEQ
ncbi:hypothetical protein STEG23_014233, partial [Scotinomys teguina]